jgi:hypothetical protein
MWQQVLADAEKAKRLAAEAAVANATPTQIGQQFQKAENKLLEVQRQADALAKRHQEWKERDARIQAELVAAKAEHAAARTRMLNARMPDAQSLPVSAAVACTIVQAKLQAKGAVALGAAGVSRDYARVFNEVLAKVAAHGMATAVAPAQAPAESDAVPADGDHLCNMDVDELSDALLAKMATCEGGPEAPAVCVPTDVDQLDGWRTKQRAACRKVKQRIVQLAAIGAEHHAKRPKNGLEG